MNEDDEMDEPKLELYSFFDFNQNNLHKTSIN